MNWEPETAEEWRQFDAAHPAHRYLWWSGLLAVFAVPAWLMAAGRAALEALAHSGAVLAHREAAQQDNTRAKPVA